jgi:hypothetical protein
MFLGQLEIWLVEIYETGHSCSGCWLNRLVRNLNYNRSMDLKGSTLFTEYIMLTCRLAVFFLRPRATDVS